jgi:hypothetical protein
VNVLIFSVRSNPRITETADTESADTGVLLYLLLCHGKYGYANAPQCYIYMYIACLAYNLLPSSLISVKHSGKEHSSLLLSTSALFKPKNAKERKGDPRGGGGNKRHYIYFYTGDHTTCCSQNIATRNINW